MSAIMLIVLLVLLGANAALLVISKRHLNEARELLESSTEINNLSIDLNERTAARARALRQFEGPS